MTIERQLSLRGVNPDALSTKDNIEIARVVQYALLFGTAVLVRREDGAFEALNPGNSPIIVNERQA